MIAVSAHAQTSIIIVDTDSDTQALSTCTLRAAIMAANSNTVVDACPAGGEGIDVINFDNSLLDSTITLNSPLPVIENSDITINGLGQDRLAINGNNTHQIFNVYYSDVIINSLTLENGNADLGGAIYSDGNSKLTINNSTLSSNSANKGGAIFASSYTELVINNSTLTTNSANIDGGAINANYDTVAAINNSTISANSASGNGGGVYSYGDSVTIINSTLSTNSATGNGGAMYSFKAETIISASTLTTNSASADGGGVSLMKTL